MMVCPCFRSETKQNADYPLTDLPRDLPLSSVILMSRDTFARMRLGGRHTSTAPSITGVVKNCVCARLVQITDTRLPGSHLKG